VKLVYIRAHAQFRPGDEVDLDVEAPARNAEGRYTDGDGVVISPPWSELYLAEPGDLAARRAIAGRDAADASPVGEPGTGGDAGSDAGKAARITAAALAAAAKDGN
jgi:hypothetical protein